MKYIDHHFTTWIFITYFLQFIGKRKSDVRKKSETDIISLLYILPGIRIIVSVLFIDKTRQTILFVTIKRILMHWILPLSVRSHNNLLLGWTKAHTTCNHLVNYYQCMGSEIHICYLIPLFSFYGCFMSWKQSWRQHSCHLSNLRLQEIEPLSFNGPSTWDQCTKRYT